MGAGRTGASTIYCDVDFLWLADIAELWALRNDKILLQSVADGAYDHRNNEEKWFSSHGYAFDPTRYFCAGMCMLNLEMMRQENQTQKLLSFIENNPDIKAHDQTALNIMCHGRPDVRMLPWYWQFRTAPLVKHDNSHRPVIHFAADTPWRVTDFTHLLTNFELLWFKAAALINGESTWAALRRHYTPSKIITSRIIYIIATAVPFGRSTLRLAMRIFAPSKDFGADPLLDSDQHPIGLAQNLSSANTSEVKHIPSCNPTALSGLSTSQFLKTF